MRAISLLCLSYEEGPFTSSLFIAVIVFVTDFDDDDDDR
jgi:hypothetical protein